MILAYLLACLLI